MARFYIKGVQGIIELFYGKGSGTWTHRGLTVAVAVAVCCFEQLPLLEEVIALYLVIRVLGISNLGVRSKMTFLLESATAK